MTSSPRLVLASGSQARLRVLRQSGIDPEVLVSGVDEDEGIEGLDTAEASGGPRRAKGDQGRPEPPELFGSRLRLDARP